MNHAITLPAPRVELALMSPTKSEREQNAFRRMLPHLLKTHRGRYVAIHEEQVVDTGDDKLALALRVLAKIGNVDIHVGLVTDEPAPIARSGVRRELRQSGEAP